MADVIIVGGGIIGMLTARELVMAGRRVTLLEQKMVGKESSWAGGGIISPLYPWRYPDSISQLARWSQQYYPELIELLYAETGLDPELEPGGLLVLDSDEQDMAQKWATKWQANLQIIENKRINEIEPGLKSPYPGPETAIWLPSVANVRNPRLVKSLHKYLTKQGVKIVENAKVVKITTRDGIVSGVKTQREDYQAAQVLVASGAWTANLLTGLGGKWEIEPVKGQMILYKADKGLLKSIILSKDRYAIPRRDGRILVGSTLEHTEFDKSTSEQAKQELKQEALRLIPGLENVEIEYHWAGLRPGTAEGIPYICEHPDIKGLYINAGHYRNGVVLGPASARLMADLILERPATFDPQAYSVLN